MKNEKPRPTQQICILPSSAPPRRRLVRSPLTGTLVLGGQQRTWSIWDGQRLGKCVAINVEKSTANKHFVPQLAMISVSDGVGHYLLAPQQLPQFFSRHLPLGHHLVFHGVAVDFSAIDQTLNKAIANDARDWLWDAVDTNRVHDTELLAALVSLATHDDDQPPELDDAVRKWCGYGLQENNYRGRFGETIGADWHQIDPGFLNYAAAAAIATYELNEKLTQAAERVIRQFALPRSFGLLTESLQVKAAVSLDLVYRRGLQVDLERVSRLRQAVDAEINSAIQKLSDIDPELWHRDVGTGQPRISAASGLPQQNKLKLEEHLQRIADTRRLAIPTTATGKLSTSVKKCWSQYRETEPLVDAYCQYTEQTKLRTFFNGLDTPSIHPQYRTLVRTGRTSCSGPNIQQLPRNSPIREAITARPGHRLFLVDYNSLELRTLATVCHNLFGFSQLREVLISGIDPHSYTAAMFAGTTLEQFSELPNHKELRQRAKVFNFGLPAGFGAASLVEHAKFNYGVSLTIDEAERFIELLTNTVYPELGLYLSDEPLVAIAKSLHADLVDVRAAWPDPYHPGMIRKVLDGNPHRRDGEPYRQTAVDTIWTRLRQLCRNQELLPHIERRNTAADSPLRQLMHNSVSTITGRVRGGVPFTAAKNTPFQGLAADGCKQAMWNLTKAGYRIVAFIHDEFIIELSIAIDIDHAAGEIAAICSDSMQPFVPGIPVPCEFALTDRWYKGAEAVYDESGRLQVWRPNSSNGGLSG
jgi:DNA polymerase I-like protein with 3'-5' exonuclease and polymerase domains